ncbi:hypothetical protein QBC43DRAFT_288806 [Cladorrhinum sp. PSN259]|nr:hypothetical protein QBC43DRAFT_288806 [Cladorrhinum sp. PSN259]
MAYKNSASSSSSPQSPVVRQSWQEQLFEACRTYSLPNPEFRIVSDRRGGRTAWSSSVTIYDRVYNARFWYDGKNLNNAKEDAAEVALGSIMGTSSPSSPSTTRSNRSAHSQHNGW